jgi:hypothetical protein
VLAAKHATFMLPAAGAATEITNILTTVLCCTLRIQTGMLTKPAESKPHSIRYMLAINIQVLCTRKTQRTMSTELLLLSNAFGPRQCPGAFPVAWWC